jgi:hypothetical protein
MLFQETVTDTATVPRAAAQQNGKRANQVNAVRQLQTKGASRYRLVRALVARAVPGENQSGSGAAVCAWRPA